MYGNISSQTFDQIHRRVTYKILKSYSFIQIPLLLNQHRKSHHPYKSWHKFLEKSYWNRKQIDSSQDCDSRAAWLFCPRLYLIFFPSDHSWHHQMQNEDQVTLHSQCNKRTSWVEKWKLRERTSCRSLFLHFLPSLLTTSSMTTRIELWPKRPFERESQAILQCKLSQGAAKVCIYTYILFVLQSRDSVSFWGRMSSLTSRRRSLSSLSLFLSLFLFLYSRMERTKRRVILSQERQ